MNDPGKKPDAPKGWSVHWSKRKNRWFWADRSKKAYWKLPDITELTMRTGYTSADVQDEHSNTNVPTKFVSTKPVVNISSMLASLSSVVPSSNINTSSSDVSPSCIPGLSRTFVGDTIQQNEQVACVMQPPDNQHSTRDEEKSHDNDSKRTYIQSQAQTYAKFDHPVAKRARYTTRTADSSDVRRGFNHETNRDDIDELKARNDHYSSVANDIGSARKYAREETPHSIIIKHSNWVKSILIEAALRVFGGGVSLNCMDLACGRGGDLHKWNKATQKFKQNINKFYGIDSAEGCIKHCRSERSLILPRKTNARWIVENLENPDVFERLCATAELAPSSIHVVSMQFALHYFFRTEQSLRSVFQLLSKSMAKGGIFACTYSDGNAIVRLSREQRWKDAIEARKKLKDEDIYYEKSSVTVARDLFSICITTDTLDAIETSTEPYGHSYVFTLGNYVRSQKEYLVVDSELDAVAESFSFYSIMEENFHPLTHAAIKVEKHKESMRIMRVFGNKPEFSDEDWEVLGIYKTRIFVYDPTGTLYKPKAKEWITKYLTHCTDV